MVEFALMLPLMALVLVGVFDLGRAFFASITITNAAREGARYGARYSKYYDPLTPSIPPYYDIKQATIREAQGTLVDLTSANATIVVTCPDTNSDNYCDRYNPVRVTVSYNYNEMILGFFFPSGIDMQRYVEMMVP